MAEKSDIQIMTPSHPKWDAFKFKLIRVSNKCDSISKKQTELILIKDFPEVNLKRSINFFEKHGGFCNCEILMNVEDSFFARGAIP